MQEKGLLQEVSGRDSIRDGIPNGAKVSMLSWLI